MFFRYIAEMVKRSRLNVNVSLIATTNIIDLDEEPFYEKMKRNRLKNLTRKFDSLFVLTK